MEKPILFSTEMVKAILDGRKTQTRRVIKPQPRSIHPYFEYLDNGLIHFDNGETGELIKMPYQPGDVLWVRETWLPYVKEHSIGKYQYAYKANTTAEGERYRQEYISKGYPYHWRPSIHMPREAARLFLRVRNIKVERLQDISEQDANAEGVKDPYDYQPPEYYEQPHMRKLEINKSAFAGLWDSINAKRGYSWKKNPWVWVIEFERI